MDTEKNMSGYINTLNLKDDQQFLRSIENDSERELLLLRMLMQRSSEKHLAVIRMYVTWFFWLSILGAVVLAALWLANSH